MWQREVCWQAGCETPNTLGFLTPAAFRLVPGGLSPLLCSDLSVFPTAVALVRTLIL